MRRTLRLLANVKPARYLEPGHPTGLAGVPTHGSPRSTLLLLYARTLEQLGRRFPESSVYRQSVEALTKHRRAIVEAAAPPGFAEWQARARRVVEAHPDKFVTTTTTTTADGSGSGSGSGGDGSAVVVAAGGQQFVRRADPPEADVRVAEWDGERDEGPGAGGLRGEEERAEEFEELVRRRADAPGEKLEWEPEPQLTADQIEEIENKIGAGLIEEVIQVAEDELKLLDIMHEARVWEPLEEKPTEGQWTYFER